MVPAADPVSVLYVTEEVNCDTGWVRGRFSDPFVTLASNKRIKMNATTWIKIFQKSGSENRPLICMCYERVVS